MARQIRRKTKNLAVPQKITVTLTRASDGSQFDLTEFVTGVNASYSTVNLPSDGLSLITGSFTLTQTDSQIDFDPRFSTLWLRGNKIECQYTDDVTAIVTLLPIVGTTYILDASYDMLSTLTIEVGCILALNNYKTPNTLGFCLELSASITTEQAIINLLDSVGITSLNTLSFNSIQGSLGEPRRIGKTESPVSTAGEIAAQHFHVIYQDNTGTIKAQDITSFGLTVHFQDGLNTVSYSGASNSESKVAGFDVQYNTISKESNPLVNVETIDLDDIRIQVTITRDGVTRTVTKTTQEYLKLPQFGTPLVLVSTTSEVATFEGETPEESAVVRTGQLIPFEECFPEDPARILSRVTTTLEDNTTVLASWSSYRNTATFPSGFTVSGIITAREVSETWSYGTTVIRQEIRTSEPTGFVVPVIGDLSLGRGVGTITDIDPTSLVTSELVVRQWVRNSGGSQTWNYEERRYVYQVAADPEYVASQVQDGTVVLQDIADKAFLLVLRERINEPNSQAPNPETFPPPDEIAYTGQSFSLADPPNSVFADNISLTESVSLGNYFNTPISYIEDGMAEVFLARNGRVLGMQVSDNLLDGFPVSTWNNIVPFMVCKIREPDPLRRNIAAIYKADSPTISIKLDEIVIAYYGNFRGNDPNPTSPLIDSAIITTPDSLPESEAIEAVPEEIFAEYILTTSLVSISYEGDTRINATGDRRVTATGDVRIAI